MSYLVLARKYRPQTFEDVVGQNPVSQTLLNALETGRVAHAYIFSGPRGVGKTTTARILAKCLNCVKGPTKTPCNECDACISISQSNSTDDVLEIDGASNRGIEQIRELRENAKYAPAKSRYRIFIIDEAHQITKDAFGALLKTLEEPPAHVVFMMATTEVQKIPAPILSRCQRFSLRPISATSVFEHLKQICAKEKIKVEDAALADIVRFVEGSMRDALSLLDQALVFSPKGITSQTVRELLGLLPTDIIHQFADRIQAGDPAEILKAVHAAVEEGVDLTQLAKDLQNFYHTLLLNKAGVEDAFKVEGKKTKQDAAAYEFPTLERNIRLLAKTLDDMRHSEAPRAIFEISALRLAQKTVDPRELIERLEKISSGSSPVSASSSASGVTPSRFTNAPEPMRPSFRAPAAQTTPSTPPSAPSPTITTAKPVSAKPAKGPISKEILEAGWADFLTDLANKKGVLQGAFEGVSPVLEGGQLTLTFSRSFSYDLVNRSIDLIKQTFTERFSTQPIFDLKLDKTMAPAPSSAAAAYTTSTPAPTPTPRPNTPISADEHFEDALPNEITPDVQKALKHFPGTVKKGKSS